MQDIVLTPDSMHLDPPLVWSGPLNEHTYFPFFHNTLLISSILFKELPTNTNQQQEKGFAENPDDWANLGQGAPEVDDEIEGSFPRPKTIDISTASREYGPTAGIKGLRAAVANLYNVHHRQGKESKYSWENVCIVPGGRAGLIRIAAVINNAYLGFFIPDYTAYSELLSLFKNVSWFENGEVLVAGYADDNSLLLFRRL